MATGDPPNQIYGCIPPGTAIRARRSDLDINAFQATMEDARKKASVEHAIEHVGTYTTPPDDVGKLTRFMHRPDGHVGAFIHEMAVIIGAPEGSSFEGIKARLMEVMSEASRLKREWDQERLSLIDEIVNLRHLCGGLGREAARTSGVVLLPPKGSGEPPACSGLSKDSPHYRKTVSEERGDWDD